MVHPHARNPCRTLIQYLNLMPAPQTQNSCITATHLKPDSQLWNHSVLIPIPSRFALKYKISCLTMDEWTIKTPNPICRLSFSWPVDRICGILFNRFYRLEIHSLMVCILDPACELFPPWTKELQYGNCVLLPLYCTYLLSDLHPPPPFPMYSTVPDVLKKFLGR